MDLINNRRETFRMPFIAEVICRGHEGEEICTGTLRDISSLGLYLETLDRPDIGSFCECEIILMGKASRLVMDRIKADVARHDFDGIALHLHDRLEWIAVVPIFFHKMK